MKICIIGNSQAAALKKAVDAGIWQAQVPVTFETYAIPGGRGPHLGIREGRIYPVKNAKRLLTDIDGAADAGLDLSGYDAVLYSAAGLPAHRLQFDFHPLNKIADASLITNRPEHKRQLGSSAIFVATIAAEIAKIDSTRTLEVLRSLYDGPIYVQGWPLPSPNLINRDDTDLPTLYGDNLGRFLSTYYGVQRTALAKACDAAGTTLLPLAIKESLTTGFTPLDYCSGEPWHMNERYGEIVLDDVMVRLTS